MAFWGCSFIFNGIPCEDFDLMMYNVSDASMSAGKFASGVTVVEQSLPNRWRPLFYGTKLEDKLKFEIVFGVNEKRIDRYEFLDRYELEAIGSWLTGHDGYRWLEINQPDMEYVRYRCIISDLQMVEYGRVPMALKATVTCDGPYAYLYPQTFEYAVNGETSIIFFNESSHNGYYFPVMEYEPNGAGTLSIVNHSDNNRVFELKDHASVPKITVDNDRGIITAGLDMYPYFNFKFLRFAKGNNALTVSGNGTLRFICEFPVNVGG